MCRIGREIEAVSSSLEWEKETAGTFKASPSEAAPSGPILLAAKLTDVTELFVCETGEVRKCVFGRGHRGVVWGGQKEARYLEERADDDGFFAFVSFV